MKKKIFLFSLTLIFGLGIGSLLTIKIFSTFSRIKALLFWDQAHRKIESGEIDEAIALLNQSIGNHPSILSYEIYITLGDLYAEKTLFSLAEEQYKKALNFVSPESYHFNRIRAKVEKMKELKVQANKQ